MALEIHIHLLQCGGGVQPSEAKEIVEIYFQLMNLNSPGFGYNLGGLWPIDTYQESHPYILDWYYTSVPKHHVAGTVIEKPDVRIDVETPDDVWMPTGLNNVGPEHGNFWEHQFEDRFQSGMAASTSAPFFQGSVLQRNESDISLTRQDMKSQWWARRNSNTHQNQPQAGFLEPPEYLAPEYAIQPQASFLEPPGFNNLDPHHHHTLNSYLDNISENSLDKQEQYLEWRNSSHHLERTTFLYGIEEEGGIQPLFDDVYPNTLFPTMNPDGTSNSESNSLSDSTMNQIEQEVGMTTSEVAGLEKFPCTNIIRNQSMQMMRRQIHVFI